MNRNAFYRLAFLVFFTCLFSIVFGQTSKGGYPLSISEKLTISIPVQDIPPPDWAKIKEEDKGKFANFRFAVPLLVNFDTENSGTWTDLSNGGRLWQLSIHSKDALGIAVAFDNFELPEGAKIYLYSPDRKQIVGAFDAANNSESRRFLAPMIKGNEVVVEYFQPKNTPKKASFNINKIFHAYPTGQLGQNGFGASLPCEININCPQGANLQTPKKGVVRILLVVEGGMGWCSGSLINNTKNDGTPYVLSAFHCDDGYTPDYALWTFYFNYESSNCTNPSVEPTLVSLQGCTLKAGRRETDFQLLQMTQRVPTTYNALFNGWNRDSTNLTTSNAMIHHPQGDIKKVSLDNQAATVVSDAISWSGAVPHNSVPRTHIQSIFDQGGMEPGSSGSPIFDANGRIIAQLHGGSYADCQVNFAYSGWLAKSWDGTSAQTRLKDWLDPTNIGVLTLGGTDGAASNTLTIAGKVRFWNGAVMPNVKVYLNNDSTTTNASGDYSFSNIAPNVDINIRISKIDSYDNGVDAVDLVLIRRHILGITEFNSSYKLLSGDVNNDGEVDAVDILLIRRLIVGINTSLPVSPPWRFIAVDPALTGSFLNSNQTTPSVLKFTASKANLDFYGFKKGDVDASAE
jgi:lysyl endopeptidase